MPGNNRGRGHDRNGKGPYRGRRRGKDGFEGTGRGVYHTLEEMGEVYLIASSAYTWAQEKRDPELYF